MCCAAGSVWRMGDVAARLDLMKKENEETRSGVTMRERAKLPSHKQ
jgi:hypothetical protein